MTIKRALLVSHGATKSTIERYLPSNYQVHEEIVTCDDEWDAGDIEIKHYRNSSGCEGHNRLVIQGEDYAGWTMEDYVLPRLASGLHFATPSPFNQEVTA